MNREVLEQLVGGKRACGAQALVFRSTVTAEAEHKDTHLIILAS